MWAFITGPTIRTRRPHRYRILAVCATAAGHRSIPARLRLSLGPALNSRPRTCACWSSDSSSSSWSSRCSLAHEGRSDRFNVLDRPAPNRDDLRRVLIHDQPDRDAIASDLLRYRDGRADDWADIIDFLTMHPEARRQVVRLVGEIDAEES